MSEGEDAWRPGILIKRHMDLAIMDAKTSNNEYNNLAEFEADAHNILHNIIIYHGGKALYFDAFSLFKYLIILLLEQLIA